MPFNRLTPLLIAGAACLPLAACGGDDEPAASATPPGVPTTTTAAPGDLNADAAPAATTDAPAKAGKKEPPAGAPAADDASAAGGAPAKPAGSEERPGRPKDRASRSGSQSGTQESAKRSSQATEDKGRRSAAPKVPKALEDYAKGGAPATPDEAASVRKTMLEFQDALVAADARKACSYTLGLPATSDPSKPTPSCESLIEGSQMAPPTDDDREMIRAAKITVNGDRASIEIGGSGVPMPFRNVDGRWRIDYGTLLGLGDAER